MGGGVDAQRPVWHGNAPKTTGARSARARTRGQNPLVLYIVTVSEPGNFRVLLPGCPYSTVLSLYACIMPCLPTWIVSCLTAVLCPVSLPYYVHAQFLSYVLLHCLYYGVSKSVLCPFLTVCLISCFTACIMACLSLCYVLSHCLSHWLNGSCLVCVLPQG